MTNRREFLQTAAALSTAPLAGHAAFAKGTGAPTLDAVIFDTRYAEGRHFGTRAGLLGASLRSIEGDITALWQDELLGRWQSGPTVMAGLTERPALFLLERLAWEHGMRVVFEAEHEPAHGGAAHRLLRTAHPGLSRELEAAGQSWPSVLADALVAGTRTRTHDFRPTDAGLARKLGEPTKLHSWIIAPRTAEGGI